MIANQNYKAFTRYDSASSVHFVSNRLVSKTGRKETLLSCEYSKIKSCSANSHSLVGTYSGNSSGCRQSDQPKILSLNLPKPSWWVLLSQLSMSNTFKGGSFFQLGLPLQNLNCIDSPGWSPEVSTSFKGDAKGFKSLFAQVSSCMAHWGHLSGKLERQQTCKKSTN